MIRRFNPGDTHPLLKLLQLNTPLYFAPSEGADFENYLENEREDYYVFELDGQVMGSGGINYFPEQELARISWDIVHPDHQGRGIGRQLLEYRLGRIKSQPGIRVVEVRTTQLVYGYYQKTGFQLEEVRSDFWAKGFDLYRMRMTIK